MMPEIVTPPEQVCQQSAPLQPSQVVVSRSGLDFLGKARYSGESVNGIGQTPTRIISQGTFHKFETSSMT
jgi:hypothetical protein